MKKMKKMYNYFPLTTRVLAVAVCNIDENNKLFDWTVYIDAVRGFNHKEEYILVAKKGCKIHKEIGIKLFPQYQPDKWRF